MSHTIASKSKRVFLKRAGEYSQVDWSEGPPLCFSFFVLSKDGNLVDLFRRCILKYNITLTSYISGRRTSLNLALMKMWFALGSMGLMFLAVASIYLSRFKCQNRFLKIAISSFAYMCMLISGIIVFVVVFSGPVNE
ncbi:hypothetical protein NRS6120_12700 [Bacillus subtilis]|nr:hypothetical protein NRS6120_12700 [Bacillus subtilis]